jgi:hypothetical protein
MRALSVRQPYAELILRGIKMIEYRSCPTRIIGELFYIYASKGATKTAWSRDLAMPGDALPKWMIELAEQVGMIEPGTLLRTDVIVGSAVIERITPPDPSDTDELFRWHLADVKRAKKLRKPRLHPQPVWFKPF